MAHVPKLFTPLRVGALNLAHRVVMAPLTRCRADPGEVQSELAVEYYTQRATEGGLIIGEATQISQEGQGIVHTPGIFTPEQVVGWKRVTDAVHKKGGFIFAQLWHMGRQSHSSYQPNGGLPVAPSAIGIKGSSVITTKDYQKVPFETPRALETSEIPRVIADYVHAAKCAQEAGFDGVEVHGANSYLIDQFLHDGTNQRTDQYGGSIENRTRFLLEVVEAVVGVWGKDRVGLRLSPPVFLEDSDKEALFTHAVKEVDKMDLAYLHLIDPPAYTRGWRGDMTLPEVNMKLGAEFFRHLYKGVLLECGGIDGEKGLAIVEKGQADAIVYGRPFVSNPDLVYRVKNNLPFAPYDTTTFFSQGPKGYTDYPTYQEERARAERVEGA